MLANGVNLAPSQFEAAFLSLAHSKSDINKTVEAARKSLKRPVRQGSTKVRTSKKVGC